MNESEMTFYVTGGTLRHDAPSYVERQADKDLLDGLWKGEFCYVLTSRQMGKSSLMVRTASKLREQGVAVVVLDLTAIGHSCRGADHRSNFRRTRLVCTRGIATSVRGEHKPSTYAGDAFISCAESR